VRTTRKAATRQERRQTGSNAKKAARSQEQAGTPPVSQRDYTGREPVVADLQAALDYLREGDVFIVNSLDRLSRSLEELRSAVLGLTGRGIVVEFIREFISLAGPDQAVSNQLSKAISVILDLQREMARVRQQHSPHTPKMVRKGRKPSLSVEEAADLRRRVAAGESKSALAQVFGISRDTLYRYLASQ
jgi:DNA invertase Pin-like site-specific DNA recombinase